MATLPRFSLIVAALLLLRAPSVGDETQPHRAEWMRQAGFGVFMHYLAEKPDLLITDFQMPIMTGLDLCKQLRTHDETKRIPAIMLTARGFDIEPNEMVEAGIAAVLAKPFSPREVLEKVTDLLSAAGTPT